MEEKWLDIPEWEELYSISNTGKVYSKRFNKMVKIKTCDNGYLSVDLFSRKGGIVRRKEAYIHRLVAIMFVEGRSEKANVVDHKDNDKTNNNADNLQWVSYSYNNWKGAIGRKPRNTSGVYIVQSGQTFESLKECAKFLNIPYDRLKSRMRFYDGWISNADIQVKYRVSND